MSAPSSADPQLLAEGGAIGRLIEAGLLDPNLVRMALRRIKGMNGGPEVVEGVCAGIRAARNGPSDLEATRASAERVGAE